MDKTFEEFVNDFDIVDNALDMRNLTRWNGRDLLRRENLSEHTHLVVACAIKIYDDVLPFFNPWSGMSLSRIIRRCMIHDSLELLRGDILSVTKDMVPGLRDFTDAEENNFMNSLGYTVTEIESDIVELADLMACYKFVENELRFPSNDFATHIYKVTKNKFDCKYEDFCKKNNIPIIEKNTITSRFKKGYEADAGVDVILTEDITIMPMSTMSINLKINVTPKEGEMAVLCARTSAAAKGLCVAMCPIDANYTGDVTAIVHNVSNQILTYKAGEAFCQIVGLPIVNTVKDVEIKKKGKRTDGKLGSTGI